MVAVIGVNVSGSAKKTVEDDVNSRGTKVESVGWVSELERCKASTGTGCLSDVVSAALKNREFTKFAEALRTVSLSSDPSVMDRCHDAVSDLGPVALASYPDLRTLIADTNELVCNVGLGQAIMVEYGNRGSGVDYWAPMVAACAEDIGNVPDGHTAPCAKGLGWGIRTSEKLQTQKLLNLCTELIGNFRDPSTANIVGFDRLYYGCTNGVIYSLFSPGQPEGMREPVPALGVIASECLPLIGPIREASMRNGSVDGPVLSSLNGCAGGVGASMGRTLAVSSSNAGDALFKSNLNAYLTACNTITAAVSAADPDGLVAGAGFGSECHAQVFRQTAYKLFSSDRSEALCADLGKDLGTVVTETCKKELMSFQGR